MPVNTFGEWLSIHKIIDGKSRESRPFFCLRLEDNNEGTKAQVVKYMAFSIFASLETKTKRRVTTQFFDKTKDKVLRSTFTFLIFFALNNNVPCVAHLLKQ